MTIIIAGVSSGVGKTTVTLSLLASLCKRGFAVQSFKVGPDYIDPMFHQYVTGRPCRNLDPALTSEGYVKDCFVRHTPGVQFALVEGVMGLFDGINNSKDNQLPIPFASTAHIALLLDLPVVLVIDCSRLSGSVAAIAYGYRNFDPRIKLAGVVLNRVGSDRHLELLQDALQPLNIPILGVLRRQDNITIPDRHLGLVPTGELNQLHEIIDRLAEIGDTCFNWEELLPLLQVKTPPQPLPLLRRGAKERVKIAVARDRAFNFYYQDNLDLLQQLGAELIFWSPLTDSSLPEKVQGLYFGGGFPEVFATELSGNIPVLNIIKTAIISGMPTYAECGGLMYLCEEIVDFQGKHWQMVGVLPTTAVMGSRLTLGYRKAIALQDSPLVAEGVTVTGHEFHRSSLTMQPTAPLFQAWRFDRSPNQDSINEGWNLHNIHASYIHLHWGNNLQLAERFIEVAGNYIGS